MRVVVVTLRPLLRDIIVELLQRHAPLTVKDLAGRAPPARLGLLAPELVVIGLRRGETDAVARRYAAQISRASVLAISSDGRDAYLHKGGGRTVLRRASTDALACALAALGQEN